MVDDANPALSYPSARTSPARSSAPLLWGAAAGFWAVLVKYASLGSRFSLDLRVYRSASRAFFSGHSPYAETFTIHHLLYTYPPFALLAFAPLSVLPAQATERLWWLFNAGCLVAVIYLTLTRLAAARTSNALVLSLLAAPILAVALEPLRSNTAHGQVNMVLLLCVLLDVIGVTRGGRGILTGLAAAIKLTPIVYLVILAAQRDWRSVVRGAASFLTATAIAVATRPSLSRLYWLHLVFHPQRAGGLGTVFNESLAGLLHHSPFPATVGSYLWVPIAALTLGLGVWLTFRLVRCDEILAATIVTGLVCQSVSPISWPHHWVWVVLVPFLLLERRGAVPWRVLMPLGLLIVAAMLGAYNWHLRGPLRALGGDSLIGSGLLVLYVWAFTEYRQRFRSPQANSLS